VEGRVASVQDIFRLVGNAELEAANGVYLPARATASAVVLAASRVISAISPRPAQMHDRRARASLLERLVSLLSDSGIRAITVAAAITRKRSLSTASRPSQ